MDAATHTAWTLTKGAMTLRCDLERHRVGLELKLWVDEQFIRSQVCRDQDEMLALQEAWRDEAEAKGWTASAKPSF